MPQKQTTIQSNNSKFLNKYFVADLVWFICFIAIWASLIMLWNSFWIIILVPLFSIMLAGLAEVIHQASHGNLFVRTRALNKKIGSLAALALFAIDLESYRRFHFLHHRNVNTIEDPERKFYALPTYLKQIENWKNLSTWQKIALLPRIISLLGETVAITLPSSSSLIKILRWGIPLAIAFIGFLEGLRYLIPLKVFIAWYLPLIFFAIIDLFLTQGEHYGTRGLQGQFIKANDQYKISWNIKLPLIITFMLMGRNMHAEHHQNPAKHWFETRDQNMGQSFPVGQYLKSWWKNGPRTIQYD